MTNRVQLTFQSFGAFKTISMVAVVWSRVEKPDACLLHLHSFLFPSFLLCSEYDQQGLYLDSYGPPKKIICLMWI